MIDRDMLTRDPTWDELSNQEIETYWDGYPGIRRRVLLDRIDAALQKNATVQAAAKDNRRIATTARQILDAENELDRLDEERVTLHTLRKLEEGK